MPAIRTSTPRDPSVPPRPRNAWIIYRSLKAKELAGQRRSFVSKEIAIQWKNETAAVKEYFYWLASQEKESHAIDHPTYRYQPRQKTKEEKEEEKKLKEERERAKEEQKRVREEQKRAREEERERKRQIRQQGANNLVPRNGTPTLPVPSMNFPPIPGPSTLAPSAPFPATRSDLYSTTFSQAVDGLATQSHLPQDNPPVGELDDPWAQWQWQWPAEQGYYSTDEFNAGEGSVGDANAGNDFGVAYDFTGHLPSTGFDVSFNPGVDSYFAPF